MKSIVPIVLIIHELVEADECYYERVQACSLRDILC